MDRTRATSRRRRGRSWRLGVNSKYVEANAAMRTTERLDAAHNWTTYLADATVEAHKSDRDSIRDNRAASHAASGLPQRFRR